MRLTTPALLTTLLATSALADSMVVYTVCTGDKGTGDCRHNQAAWYSGFESGYIDANEGCRDPNVGSMNNLCMDWGNWRGHFYFDGQGKRCIKHKARMGNAPFMVRNRFAPN
ncbi:hypothetical protein N0V88_007500 [Collariella sp. IMI 366227]|nr:hypothetical protein N0V88_007500 [Collariella sp. IMI 366227]